MHNMLVAVVRTATAAVRQCEVQRARQITVHHLIG